MTDSQFGISVLLNQGKGKYVDGLFTSLGVAAGCGVTGDFNGDGKPDLAVNTAQGISVLLGTGKPSPLFNIGTSIPLDDAGCLAQTADLNGDGILDLALTSSTGVVIYLGNGDGTFRLGSTSPTTTSPSVHVVLADFNHDGKLDYATDGNQLALGNGDGTFQTAQTFANPPQFGFSNIAVGDINNDGWPDLVLTLNYNADAYVLLNNHHGGFYQVPTNYGEYRTGAILVDLNADGKLDLVLNEDIYLGDGRGNFTTERISGGPGRRRGYASPPA